MFFTLFSGSGPTGSPGWRGSIAERWRKEKTAVLTRIVATLLLNIGLGTGLLLAPRYQPAAGRPADLGPVYTVAQVLSALVHNPAAWSDRTVLVRGMVMLAPCPPNLLTCPPRQVLVDDTPAIHTVMAYVAAQLPLAVQSPAPSLTFLRQIPVLGRLLPPAPAIKWDVVAIYRVRLRATSCAPISPACYLAVVQDSTSAS
jgi:hypothetical protein